jgi:hypothetical protein
VNSASRWRSARQQSSITTLISGPCSTAVGSSRSLAKICSGLCLLRQLGVDESLLAMGSMDGHAASIRFANASQSGRPSSRAPEEGPGAQRPDSRPSRTNAMPAQAPNTASQPQGPARQVANHCTDVTYEMPKKICPVRPPKHAFLVRSHGPRPPSATPTRI